MKKLLLIMAAALMTMTQCRKQETVPVTPADTMKMTVTAGPGRTDINTATGAITWSAGDKLYVSDGTSWLGSLTLVSGADTPQGTFTGSVTGLDDEGAPCHFFYLGKGNIATTPTGSNDASISMAAQDGTLAGAMKYHLGYGNTDVTVTEGEATGSVIMNTKIAIAHINFTTDGTQPYTGSLTMGGAGVSNEMTVSPGGAFTGSGTDGITIDNGDGITGERYVTLIPTAGTDRVDVAFTGDAAGSMTFAKGIHENKFYGMKDAIAVTLEAAAPKFTVGMDGVTPRTVEFAPGNLYYDGSDGKWKFEANQWGTDPTSSAQWNPSHVSHFLWSPDKSVAVGTSTSVSGSTSDVFFTNATQTTANPDFHVNGETGTNQWRTLSNGEWAYLLNSRANAPSLRGWVTLTDVNVSGLVILPDGSTVTASSVTTTTAVASSGAVFLPAAGSRNGTGVNNVGSVGLYWSSTPGRSNSAYCMYFDSGSVDSFNDNRSGGYSVRLVR